MVHDDNDDLKHHGRNEGRTERIQKEVNRNISRKNYIVVGSYTRLMELRGAVYSGRKNEEVRRHKWIWRANNGNHTVKGRQAGRKLR